VRYGPYKRRTASGGVFGEVGVDQGDLVEGGLEVLDDPGGDDVRLLEGRGVVQALVAQPEDVEVGLVAGDEVVVVVRAPAALRSSQFSGL
jgi:hypothetical protein